MKVYNIFLGNTFIKSYKYERCMYKYINKLRSIELSRFSLISGGNLVTDDLRIVDNFGQIYFI